MTDLLKKTPVVVDGETGIVVPDDQGFEPIKQKTAKIATEVVKKLSGDEKTALLQVAHKAGKERRDSDAVLVRKKDSEFMETLQEK